MRQNKDIDENEIRVIGDKGDASGVSVRAWLKWTIWGLMAVGLVVACVLFALNGKKETGVEKDVVNQSYFEPVPEVVIPAKSEFTRLGMRVDSLAEGFVQIKDTTINDILLRIYIPHNATMTLHVGKADKNDASIIFAAQAADIRRDNKKIVGAFVLKGTPLAWGLSKTGYCAIINNKITIGVADNSPLFETATETEGYFFRQYPLVNNGELVENEPKNKSIRRSLCDRRGEIMMVESLTEESFHDFAQALVDLGVTNAIYMVGSSSFGWAVDGDNNRLEFGLESRNLPKNTSYIIWRKVRN